MLKNINAMATIAVRDVKAAREFYQGKLGLAATDSGEPSVLALQSGASTIMIYQSQYAGTNKATSATWAVGEGIEGIVKSLKAQGVSFEHYDLPDTTRQGDVHVSGGRKVAWCKDPDGNILCLVNG